MIPIEKCLNCTRAECSGGLPECHVKGAAANLIEERRALELYRRGLSDRKIAKMMSVSPSSICKWRNGKGLKPNYNRGVKIIGASGSGVCA